MNKFRQEADLLYGALYPICEYNYSKKVHTAEDMMRTRQGNCFTLAEKACQKLMENNEVASVGIVLEAGKRNSHAYCLAFAANLPGVAILDLIDGKARYPHITRRTRKAILETLAQNKAVLYRSVNIHSNVPILDRAVLADNYTWPEASTKQRVYLPAEIGMTALTALARAGGMHQNLSRDQLEPQYGTLVPTIPAH